MSYNKNNYENNRLTPKQETFAEEIAKGKTQRQAYLIAYPNSKNYKENTIDSRASVLMKNKKIIKRLNELKQLTEKKVEWTRKRALNEIDYVLTMNKKDMERQEEAYETELQILEARLTLLAKSAGEEGTNTQYIIQEMNDINDQMVRLRQKRRVSAVNTNGILNAAKVLNRMFGYDITKVEINTEDEERKNIEKLSTEELKVLADSIINGTAK